MSDGKDYSVSNLELINYIRDELNQLSSTEKLIAIMLASRRNSHTLQCNPSHNTIAKNASVNRRTSINAINSLVQKGIIVRLYDKFKSNHYLFYWDIHQALTVCQNNYNCIFTEEEIERYL